MKEPLRDQLKRKLATLMQKSKKLTKETPVIPEHERPLGHLLKRAEGIPFEPLRSLEDARRFGDAHVIFQGDWGGQIYLTAPISEVRCSMDDLQRLLKDLDASQWECNEGEGADIFFERMHSVPGVPGGMGGGAVEAEVWIHQDLVDAGLSEYIISALHDEPTPGR